MKSSLNCGEHLSLQGVQENNLKSLSLNIPHDAFVVVSGVSGSGKSTLAFDTIYAEGGRRYIETFSPYTRQFLDRLHKPKLEHIDGVRPALALEQRNRATNSRSTVGTVTEINDYLKIVWAQLATLHCPACNQEVKRYSTSEILAEIRQRFLHSQFSSVLLAFPVPFTGQASVEALLSTLTSQGFVRLWSTSEERIIRLADCTAESIKDQAELLVVLDRIDCQELEQQQNLVHIFSSLTQCLTFGRGHLSVLGISEASKATRLDLNNLLLCSCCNAAYPIPTPSMFSFNSPLGACPECHGFGKVLRISRDLVVPDPRKSIADGAIVCWNSPATKKLFRLLKAFCERGEIDMRKPWMDLPAAQQDLIFAGEKIKKGFPGVLGWFEKLQRKIYKMHVRVFLSRYREQQDCPTCKGSRLTKHADLFRVQGLRLPELWALSIDKAVLFFQQLREELAIDPFAGTVIEEVSQRLQYLCDIGLNYLTLDRQTRTLSGGENQRVNLTTILGSRLVNTTLVLDEPTIGLHPRDTRRLLATLISLRDRGNSVVVVEHDQEVIQAADQVIDLGPSAGNAGGEIVFQGSPAKLLEQQNSLTGQYISGKKSVRRLSPAEPAGKAKAKKSEPQTTAKLQIVGARANNLKNIDVSIPLHQLVVVTGVSGSGKSSLIERCLLEPFAQLKRGVPAEAIRKNPSSSVRALEGIEAVDDILLIDQSPVGTTPRSNPATYTGIWDHIREAFAETPEAIRLGLGKSAFSFNVDGGRCPHCKGAGHVRVEMQFLADVFVECEACGGLRFQDKVLGIRYLGKTVQDFLQMSLSEVAELFEQHGEPSVLRKIQPLLAPLIQLDLGYLRLGQPLSQVSGGEAQRIKLASYLHTEQEKPVLFVLDEPTTGLHPKNVHSLLQAFDALLASGHSVLCIEHNLDVIREADWLIDLGPDGGDAGGELIGCGPVSDFLTRKDLLKRSLTSAYLLEQRGRAKASEPAAKANAASLPLELPLARSQAIQILGAREHNLKNISLSIPRNELCVITGVSGSGKSTLAFDILFAEGQRRYIDCLSPYARQYITQLQRAEVDKLIGLPPTVAVSQKTSPPLGVSTLATVTELYQFLRLLYSKVGSQHCPKHNLPIENASAEAIATDICSRHGEGRVFLFAPVVSGRKGSYQELFQRALRAELSEARIDGKIRKLSPELRLERHKLHTISLLIGSIKNPAKNQKLVEAAVEQALLLGSGSVEVVENEKDGDPSLYSTERVCPKCKTGFLALDPQDFSFRSQRGVCKRCGGTGCVESKVARVSGLVCPDCQGARIGPIGRSVLVFGKAIHELTALTAPELLAFFQKQSFPARVAPVVEPILAELQSRLQLIINVGLDYLRLDRDAFTLSSGEAQRLRLARSLGSPLSGICYVLDEPTVGLHPADHSLLMRTLNELKDAGNTVVVVEHDEETIRAADHIIDIGPVGGIGGGYLVATGSVTEIEANETSVTGQELRKRSQQQPEQGTVKTTKRSLQKKGIRLRGASANNLKNINVDIPTGGMVAVVGISGAGKSSLVHHTLLPALQQHFLRPQAKKKGSVSQSWGELILQSDLERVIEIDQTPIGRTPTSTPASYLGIFDEIRKVYAQIPDALVRGWNASYFSCNSGAGRCETCSGRGFLKVPMSFLPDAVSECESCNGLRYHQGTQDIRFQGLSIGELLQKTMSEAGQIFVHHKKIHRVLDYIERLGLGYLTLGQPTYTLSGGEAQRLKIAEELGSREANKTLYILDEPTIGLHMADVGKLIAVLQQLIDQGNTVVVIEHNLDVVAAADFVLELGPGPGERGGQIVFTGSPEELRRQTPATLTGSYLRGSGMLAAAEKRLANSSQKG